MERSKVKVEVTLKQVNEAPLVGAWEDMCTKYGINYWCMNEGLAKDQDIIKVSLADAEKWGIIKKD